MAEVSGIIEIIPNAEELEEYAEFAGAHSFGFEYNDFFEPELLDDKEALDSRIALYKGLHRQKGMDTLHGAFYDIVPFSWDGGIRRHSVYRMQQSVEIAGELGCRGVIFHTGLMPGLVEGEKYRANWLSVMAQTMRTLLRQDSGLEIYLENMFDESARELADLAQTIGEERFGVCLDIGHMALVSEEPEQWFKALAPHIRHFHMNDNHLKRDEHMAIGDGCIEWNRVFGLIQQYGLWDRSILLEVNGLEKIKSSMEYLSQCGHA